VRRAPVKGAIVTGVVAAMLAGAPAAFAAISHHLTFHARGSNGYRISVDASPSARSVIGGGRKALANKHRGAVTLRVAKDGVSSSYTVPAKVATRRIKARLRGFGRIAMKFHPEGARAVPKRAVICEQLDVTTPGTYRGKIRFRGEHGYTRVRAHRARGDVGPRQTRCFKDENDHGTELIARAESTGFVALRDDKFSFTAFLAAIRERRHGVLINRRASRLADTSEFTFDAGLSSAHVGPARPFSGSADFAGPNQWSGPLSVSFPGEPDVPLAGSDFTAVLKSY
jgi:hypothetical protein